MSRKAFFPAAIVIVVAVALHRFWNHSVLFRDSFHNFAPFKYLLAETLRSGSFPGWFPWSFLGTPFAGNLEASCFYPLNVFYLILPFEVGHRLYILSHFPLAAVSLAFFLRGRGLNRVPAALGGLAYALSGYMTSQHATVTMLIGAAWAPLALAFADRAIRGGVGFTIGSGAVLALQLLGGAPQSVLVTALLVVAISVPRLREFPRRVVVGLGTTAVAAAGLGAVQLLPSVEMMRYTARGAGVALSDSTVFSFHPGRLVELVWPSPFGSHWPVFDFWASFAVDGPYNTPWSITNYVGLPLFTLAVLGVVLGGKRLCLGAGAAAVGFLLIAFGHHTPLYGFLHHTVPLFELFRYPAKYMAWFTGCICVLAAFGFQKLLESIETRPRAVARATAIWASATIVLVALSAPVWSRVAPRTAIVGLTTGGAQLAVVVVLVSGIVFLLARRTIRVAVGAPLLLAVMVADWTVSNVGEMPIGPTGIFHDRPLVARVLAPSGRPTLGAYRVFREPMEFRDPDPDLSTYRIVRKRTWERNTLRRNLDAMEGFEDLVGYSGIKLAGGLDLLKDNLSTPMLELYNVRYVIAPHGRPPFRGIRSIDVESDARNDFTVLRLPDALPRAYWVPSARYARDERAALEIIRTERLGASVLLIGDEIDERPPGSPEIVPVELTSYEPDRVVVRSDVDRDGWLVLSDRFFPGWTALLDGEPVTIRRANVMVRAVRVPAGLHTVEFRYRPGPLFLGTILSGVSWALAAVAGGVLWRRARS